MKGLLAFWVILITVLWILLKRDEVLLLGAAILIINILVRKSTSEGYSGMSRCEMWCRKDKDGLLEDPFGCCDCKTNEKMGGIITNDQESTRLNRKCLCDNGYEDWCYKQSTNFLLGL